MSVFANFFKSFSKLGSHTQKTNSVFTLFQPNPSRSALDLSALPLVNAEPYPMAVANSSMYCNAHPAEIKRSMRSIFWSPFSKSTISSSSNGARCGVPKFQAP